MILIAGTYRLRHAFAILDIATERQPTEAEVLVTKSCSTLLGQHFKFPRYNMKCRGKHDTTVHFILYRGKSISFGTVYKCELERILSTLYSRIYV